MFRLLRTIIYIVFYVIEALLAVRFLLKFFRGNESAQFAVWINSATNALVAPFQNIFPPISLGVFLIDLTTLIALLIYSFIVYIIMRALYFLEFPRDVVE